VRVEPPHPNVLIDYAIAVIFKKYRLNGLLCKTGDRSSRSRDKSLDSGEMTLNVGLLQIAMV
jgi:hypothetical protein